MGGTQVQQMIRRPTSVQDTGLTMGLLGELALKFIYNVGEISASEVSRELHLPFAGVIQPTLELLDREELVKIIGASGFGERTYQYTISRKGIERVRQALDRSQYVGPAPVPLERYNAVVHAQAIDEILFTEDDLKAAFEGLVINPRMFDQIGPALNSGKSILLYGPPGSGKTTVAGRMARLLAQGQIYIPYAVVVDSYIIKIHDDSSHKRISTGPPAEQRKASDGGCVEEANFGEGSLDKRWVLIERPTVVVGGELTLESLDLIWDPVAKYYEAPLQMKANGGMLLVDDFGRQKVDPREVRNRWLTPLEMRADYLSLHTGKKIEIPFEQLVVFSTNLDPTTLVDEAFLRRIRHKIKMDGPAAEEFHQVFQIMCRERGVEYTPGGFARLVGEWYVKSQRDFENSHPGDILYQLLDIAKYKRLRPVATPEMIDRACSAYFADFRPTPLATLDRRES